jgi:hypothetical protein
MRLLYLSPQPLGWHNEKLCFSHLFLSSESSLKFLELGRDYLEITQVWCFACDNEI